MPHIFNLAGAYAAEEARCKNILEGLYENVHLLSSDENPIIFSVAKSKVEDLRGVSYWFEISYVRNALGGLDNPTIEHNGKCAIIIIEAADHTFEVEVYFDRG